MTKAKRLPIDRRMITILLIIFVQMAGTSMVQPILPLYAQSEFNMSPEVITLLMTVFFAAQFLAGPFIGRISDRRGRLPVLIISQIGTVISFVMIGLAQSVAVLFFARVLDGITGGNIVVAQAYITDIVPVKQRTVALGYLMAAFGLGFVVGPAAGGIFASLFGPSVPFLIAAAAATGTVILTQVALEESLSDDDRERNRKSKAARIRVIEHLTNAPLIAVLSVGFVARFAFGMLIGTFALYAESILFAGADFASVSLGVGLMLMGVGVGQLLTQVILLPAALNRFSDSTVVLIGCSARASSLFILAVAKEPLLGSVGIVIFSVGSGLLLPSLQSITTKTVAQELRGAILGLFQSAQNLALIISTAIAGAVFALDPTLPNWMGALLFCAALIPGLFLWKSMRHESFVQSQLPRARGQHV